MELDIEVNKLKMLKAQYLNDKYRLQGNVNKILPEKIKDFKSKIQLIEKDKLREKLDTLPHDYLSMVHLAYDSKQNRLFEMKTIE